MITKKRIKARLVLLSVLMLASVGCQTIPQTDNPDEEEASSKPQIPAVDVAIARIDTLNNTIEYIGTTQPVREVGLRSQAEGQLLNLAVNLGDRVTQGQLLAQLDDGLLKAAVSKAQADLAIQESEVIQAQAEVNAAITDVESAKVQLEQAKVDVERLQELYEEGAIAQREVELAHTQYRTTKQTLIGAQSQVNVRKSAVEAAKGRVIAQNALIDQEQKRLSYTRLMSPITGYVLQRVIEPGNLVQPGDEILRLGDFSQVKIIVPVSELELSNLRVGQSVRVRLDAFPRDSLVGRISNISPAADPIARQVPIEVILPNPSQKIGSGLLARVNFYQGESQPVVIPETALKVSQELSRGGRGTIFVVTGDQQTAIVRKRMVKLGEIKDGKVEVLSGMQPGERFVSRSSSPLQDNQSVRLSVLSE